MNRLTSLLRHATRGLCTLGLLLGISAVAHAQNVTNGQTLYTARCQACHGAGATNASDNIYGKVGNAGSANTASDITILTNACNNKMNCGSPAVTSAQIADIVAFIQSKNGNLPVAAPAASLSGTSLAFGSVVVNTTSGSQQVTLTNTGTAALAITGIALGGANASDFAAAGGTCVTGNLNAAASCTLAYTFTPTASGARAATVTVTHNAANKVGSTSVVNLSGTGSVAAQPAISVTPTTISYATTALNTSAPTQTVTVKNTGQAALSINAPALSGANAGDFSATNACPVAPSTLAVNATCTVTLGFSPTATGTRSATLAINSNASNAASVNVALSGQAVTAIAPAMTASVASLDFGNQSVGATSIPMTVTISDTGNASLMVTSVSSSNTAFAVNNPCTNIAAGATCDVSITFTPSAAGASSGMLTIKGNGVPDVTVALAGTGVASTTSSGGGGAATGDAINGQKLYQANCATCHQADPLKNVSKVANGVDASRIQWAITNNRGGMSSLSFLTAQNLNDMATYIGSRTSQKPTLIAAASAGAAPTAAGPVANVGGGGCSVATGNQRDLSLAMLLFAALGVFGLRRLRAARRSSRR